MKVCLIGPAHPFRGGIAHYTTLLYLELKKYHQVRFISLARQYPSLLFPGKTQTDASRSYIEVDNTPLLDTLNPWSWYRTAKEIRRLKPDLLVIQWWHPFFALPFGAVAFLAKRRSPTKVCFVCHNVFPHDRSFIDRVLTRLAFSTGDGFVLHSKKDEEDLRKLRPAAKIERVMHPTYDAFAMDNRLRAGEAKERLDVRGNVLLFFGYVRPYKGLIHLVRALPRVLAKLDCILLIVGEFYEKKEPYLEEIQKLGIGQSVRIVDRYVPNEEIPLYFSAADIVVLPYVSATQSGVVQMAYAFGKPVITTDVGGLPEAVRNGETGFIVPAENPGALAEAILLYFEMDKQAEFERNVEKFSERFSWGQVGQAIENMVSV